jgi:hypothetical protein
MMDEKHFHNPVGSEHYRPGDLISHEEDKHFSLEDGKEEILDADAHYTHEEDKTVVSENSRWCLGCCSDKVVRKMFWKEQDLILLLVGYDMSSPQHGVE